jgi:hypothetical protein
MRYKNIKFGRDRLLLDGTLRREEGIFSDVSRLPCYRSPSNTMFRTLRPFPTKRIRFISIGRQWRAPHFKIEILSRLYLFFHLRYFPEHPYLALSPHVLLNLEVLWRSVNKEGYFTWRTKEHLVCTSLCIRGIFPKHHVINFAPMPYKKCMFG